MRERLPPEWYSELEDAVLEVLARGKAAMLGREVSVSEIRHDMAKGARRGEGQQQAETVRAAGTPGDR
jgi:hypothetical protein